MWSFSVPVERLRFIPDFPRILLSVLEVLIAGESYLNFNDLARCSSDTGAATLPIVTSLHQL